MNATADIGSDAERRAQGVVELVVPELAGTLAFFVAVGFAVERQTLDFIALCGYGCRVFLARDPAVQSPPIRGCNLRIIVDDVDDVHRRVVDSGGQVVRELADRGYGLRDFSIAGPNGFALRFAQVLDT